MKKMALGLLLVFVAAGLMGCHTPKPVREEALQPMAQSYRGVLPCADCAGIDTSLFLAENGTFILQHHYQTDRPGNRPFATYGKWARTADKLVLTDVQGEKSYFRPLENGLEMLDRDGAPIVSSNTYRLTATKAPLPTTPMAMRGLYRYMADAAVFADCFTGVTYPVVNNIVMEKRYLQVRKSSGDAVLLTFSAHFAVVPSMEEGMEVKSLVPSSAPFQMKAQNHCNE
ncbi:envelope stress response activation lipoprotein NlpE [Symbiopectobacterium sp.]|uniref:envelope stress response activation lipoprotein NlpE n=1 Tax=Symbiopectobacterium sp. TaxID=2952789 RepID=UPI003F353235